MTDQLLDEKIWLVGRSVGPCRGVLISSGVRSLKGKLKETLTRSRVVFLLSTR